MAQSGSYMDMMELKEGRIKREGLGDLNNRRVFGSLQR